MSKWKGLTSLALIGTAAAVASKLILEKVNNSDKDTDEFGTNTESKTTEAKEFNKDEVIAKAKDIAKTTVNAAKDIAVTVSEDLAEAAGNIVEDVRFLVEEAMDPDKHDEYKDYDDENMMGFDAAGKHDEDDPVISDEDRQKLIELGQEIQNIAKEKYNVDISYFSCTKTDGDETVVMGFVCSDDSEDEESTDAEVDSEDKENETVENTENEPAETPDDPEESEVPNQITIDEALNNKETEKEEE